MIIQLKCEGCFSFLYSSSHCFGGFLIQSFYLSNKYIYIYCEEREKGESLIIVIEKL